MTFVYKSSLSSYAGWCFFKLKPTFLLMPAQQMDDSKVRILLRFRVSEKKNSRQAHFPTNAGL